MFKERLSVFEAASGTVGGSNGLDQKDGAKTPISPICPISPIESVLNYDLKLENPYRFWRNTSGRVIRACIPPPETI